MTKLVIADIASEYAPYHLMPAFADGTSDYYRGLDGSEHYRGVEGQAYDRGAECAMRVERHNYLHGYTG